MIRALPALLRGWAAQARRLLLGAAGPVRGDAPAADLADAPLDVLAAKIVFSYLRNRQQLLGPPPTALGHLDAPQTELLIRAAISAAQAGGRFTAERERRLRGALSAAGLQVEGFGFVAAAIRSPVPLDSLLGQVTDAHLASMFYTASLLGVDRHDAVDRSYLAFLAARLRLPAEVLARLHSQHGLGEAAGTAAGAG